MRERLTRVRGRAVTSRLVPQPFLPTANKRRFRRLPEAGSCWRRSGGDYLAALLGRRVKLTGKHANQTVGRRTAMTIAAIGATGNTGRAVVKELRALGTKSGLCCSRYGQSARSAGQGCQNRGRGTHRPPGAGKGARRRSKRVRGHRAQSQHGRAAEQRARRSAQSRHPISGTGRRQPPANQGGFGISPPHAACGTTQHEKRS